MFFLSLAVCLPRLWRDPAFKYFLIVVAGLLAASAAHAAELPAGVFQMHDGAYFYPRTGFVTSHLDEMVAQIGSVMQERISASAPPILSVIHRARQLLSATTTPPRVETSDTGWRTVTLALWNQTTSTDVGAIRTITFEKKGTKIHALSDSIRGIRVVRSNGVNSEFAVEGGDVVVAIRYPIYTDKKGSKHKMVYDVTDVVYTPYSRALHTREMVMEGKRWFHDLISRVFDALRKESIPSRAFPNTLLADAVDPAFVATIALIEHLDDRALRQDALRQIEAFYVTLAANEDDAYDFSRSKAGALGLVQFMPKTYAALTRWPNLNLEKNFEKGMRDPTNAIRAQVAYLDYLLSRLPDEAMVATTTQRKKSHEYVAAAYNGGATRVAHAMSAWEENLDPNERQRVKNRSRLKLETMKYVLKLREVRAAFSAILPSSSSTQQEK